MRDSFVARIRGGLVSAAALALVAASAGATHAQYPNLDLDLPKVVVSNRVSLVTRIEAGAKKTCAELEGPGCIRHI